MKFKDITKKIAHLKFAHHVTKVLMILGAGAFGINCIIDLSLPAGSTALPATETAYLVITCIEGGLLALLIVLKSSLKYYRKLDPDYKEKLSLKRDLESFASEVNYLDALGRIMEDDLNRKEQRDSTKNPNPENVRKSTETGEDIKNFLDRAKENFKNFKEIQKKLLSDEHEH